MRALSYQFRKHTRPHRFSRAESCDYGSSRVVLGSRTTEDGMRTSDDDREAGQIGLILCVTFWRGL